MDEPAPDNAELKPKPGPALVWLLAIVIFAVYFFVSTRSTIWDRDEARFCRATDEMIWSKNYLYPTFLGELRPDKPILIYWMMSIPVSIFGRVEWAYRLWAVIATVCSCVLTYKIGRVLFNRSVGLWAMGILATNGLVAFVGAVGTTDAVLLAEMTWMALVFARALKGGSLSVKNTGVLALLVAAGLMTKGPVALLPVAVFVVARQLLVKELGASVGDMLKTVAALVVGGGLFAAWFIPANNATNGEFFKQAFGHHVVDRMTTPLEHHGGYGAMDFAFYFLVIFAAFFPWTFFLPAALVRTNKGVYGGRVAKVFLFTWIGLVLGTMLAVSTKLPHYILPMWPALALMCACVIDEYKQIPYWEYAVEQTPRTPSGGWYGLGGFLFLLTALALGAGLALGQRYFGDRLPDWGGFFVRSQHVMSVFGALIALVCFPIGVRWRARHAAWNARVLIAGFLAFLVSASWLLLAEFEPLKISSKVAAIVRARSTPNTPVLLLTYDEASLIYYLEKHPIANLSKERVEARQILERAVQTGTLSSFDNAKVQAEALSIWAGKAEPGILVIGKSDNDNLRSGTAIPVLNLIDEVHGVNYSRKGKYLELLVQKRSE